VGIGYLAIKGSRPVTDGELAARFAELIPASAEINRIVWGEGIPADPDADPALDSVTGAQYRVVSPDSPYQTVGELRKAIEAVYSERFVREHIAYIVFDGDDGIFEEMKPRYKAMKTVDGGVAAERLGVDITNKGFKLSAVIDPASVRYSRRVPEWNGLWWDSDRIVVTAAETYNGVTSEREISMRLQDGVLYLDEATY
jgi:hypothetical protein